MEESKNDKIVEETIKTSVEDSIEKQAKELENIDSINKIKEEVNNVVDTDLMEELLNNNLFTFEADGKTYRVRKPTFIEKQETNNNRIKKYVELLKDPCYIMEKELKELYKNKGIDIDAMDDKIRGLTQKKNDFLMKLGKALKTERPDDELKIYRDEIEKAQGEIQSLTIQKTNLLEVSVEQQITIYVYSYLTYLVTEQQVGEEWKRVWKTFDEFNQSEDTKLINMATFYSSIITSNELT